MTAKGDKGNPGDEAERVSRLVGELLIGLGEKVRAAGPEGVRVLTEEELQRQQLNWFRAGWQEHARATEPPRSDAPPARLLHFPERPQDDGHGGYGSDRAP
ncbi:hypothetical protein G5C60_08230 [Streptomyces sp. HC44]|uniref:Uncharacterized protein n=1 Tax=Streptomyces scabichelini TaxID=2711217 RepID=A0A6G4V166_9ACTN|nr:hypothetical protein [Streptomyces scabichelini]NGO07640.1 hypothetical protein [Streptomyces scabichelini]